MRRLQERLEATIRRAALAEDESDERILALTAIQGLTEILLILLQLVWRRQHPEAADPLPEADDPPPKHADTKHKDTDDDIHSDDEPKKKAAKLEPVSSPGGASDSHINTSRQ